ncbi:DUF4878 domain-containing protein [Nocardioides immobilis]|nr:DUF4878 domain-containing protein [Nocardioides immobilis]
MRAAARRTSAAALAGCLAVALTSCGGDPRTEEGAADTVEAYLEEFADGDGAGACDLMTEDYAEEFVDDWNESGFGADEEAEDCADAVEASLALAEGLGEADFDTTDITAEVDGDRATATVEYEDGDSDDESYDLVYDDGDWLIDGQEEVAAEQ